MVKLEPDYIKFEFMQILLKAFKFIDQVCPYSIIHKCHRRQITIKLHYVKFKAHIFWIENCYWLYFNLISNGSLMKFRKSRPTSLLTNCDGNAD